MDRPLILVGGDIVPTNSNRHLFESGDVRELIGEQLFDILDHAGCRVFNLEVPLTDREEPIPKSGPNLIAPVSTIEGYKSLKIDLLTLANNHIMDQGAQGLASTIEVLDRTGIAHAGAGDSLSEAKRSYFIEVNGRKIGIYACAEHEFSIATDSRPGANPYDPLESFTHVSEMSGSCDYSIVLYHGGKEHYRYPSPLLQKTCRKFVEHGADLVVCQHSHCIGCEEKYLDGTIVYGQGNFIFDSLSNEFWDSGILAAVSDSYEVSYIPYTKTNGRIRLAEADAATVIMNGFWSRSEEIKGKGAVEEKYCAYARTMVETYLVSCMGGRSLLWRALNKLSRGMLRKAAIRYRYSGRRLLALKNLFECEAHRELIAAGIMAITGTDHGPDTGPEE